MSRKSILCGILFSIILTLELSSCGTKETNIIGKYNAVYEDGIYYNFVDGTHYITNDLWEAWNINDSGTGTYVIDGNKVTAYVNGDEYKQRALGYIYKNYIGSWWEGELPTKSNKTTEITEKLFDIDTLYYRFKEDDTYEYTIMSNNEVVFSEVGVYEIKGKVITCTNENNKVTTFMNTKDGIFSVNFIKE